MKKILLGVFCSFLFISCTNQKTEPGKNEKAGTETKQQQAEFADSKYVDIGKKGIADLSSGDIDPWMSSFADNAVYRWNNGDSLVGKPAISAYWKKRRNEFIDSITFSNEIWFPIKVNQPQSTEKTGNYLLSWYRVQAKYKTGKKMSQSIHTVMHFDANDKIDFVSQYLDRVPINAAMTK